MPWFRCKNQKREKLVVARDIKQAERLAHEYLELPYAKCEPYTPQPGEKIIRKKKPVGVKTKW